MANSWESKSEHPDLESKFSFYYLKFFLMLIPFNTGNLGEAYFKTFRCLTLFFQIWIKFWKPVIIFLSNGHLASYP